MALRVQIITSAQAAAMIQSGSTLCSQGMGGNDVAEELMLELEKRFLETGQPEHLSWIHSSGQGDKKDRGLNHLAHEGLLDWIIGGHFGPATKVQELIAQNKIQAYNLPQGVISHMFRDMAAKRPTISRIGLETFVDPRVEGGKLNERTTEDIVQLMELDGMEYLRYRHVKKPDYALLRGTYADEQGNISLEEEPCYLESLQAAQAVKNNGGIVFVQVKQVVPYGTLDMRKVRIPGTLVDYVVPVSDLKNHMMTFDEAFNPAYCGNCRVVIPPAEGKLALDAKKVISRRAAMELRPNSVINLGIGVPEGVGKVAEEEGLRDALTLSIESGPIGGVPVSDIGFGASLNPDCILFQSTQFDSYDGGGLDLAYLGLAEADRFGNVNVSKFGPKIAGAGGFINITQSTHDVIFCGTMTAGGLKVQVQDGKLTILQEGRVKKLVQDVQQITFSGNYANRTGQNVLYITERAVFKLTEEGMTLLEIAPGVDLERDILGQMGFRPHIAADLKEMDSRIFQEQLMGLSWDTMSK
ncbi:MAG: acyl CoA:acetate/3-ketoacid CoA transferase [Oscillibacter sp.]|nr:acyl CoA:acetate/3-ketoacid CoA transferase [Oscillibacter sp.]MCI9002356.1 acyl CoA:acetate/3-ketoacid CoA transferase [Oscillibacter sp.]